MKTMDFFRLNDWNLRMFLVFILSFLLSYDIIFLTNSLLFKIPLLTQLLGFIFLTILPGFVILRIMNIHKVDRTTTFLLAVGLSVTYIMLVGFFMNLISPFFMIEKPISMSSLLYSHNIFFLILVFLCYWRDNKFKADSYMLEVEVLSKFNFIIILPIVAIFGSYYMNYYHSNLFILVLLFVVSLTPIIVVYNVIPEKYYPFLIFSIAISVLYQMTLISTYIWGYDVFYQSYGSHLIAETGIWNLNTDKVIPILLVTILVPSYSILCKISVISVYKIVLPLLFSLTALVLYKFFCKLHFKFDSQLALLSVFTFVFYYGFFKDMPDKQHIAEFFLALILLLAIIDINNKQILVLLFSFSLITTHYAVSYLFILSLIGVFLLTMPIIDRKDRLFSINYVILFFVLALSWYFFFTSSSVLTNILVIAQHFIGSLSDFFHPDSRSGLNYALKESSSLLWTTYKLLHIFLQIFISIGIINLLVSMSKKQFKYLELGVLSIFFYALIVIQVIKTYGMGFDRIFQITLILVAPLSLFGLFTIYEQVSFIKNVSFLNKSRCCRPLIINNFIFDISNKGVIHSIKVIFALFLMIFYLFNSGFVFSIVDDDVPSYCISLNNNSGWPLYNEGEINGILWLKNFKSFSKEVAVLNEGTTYIKSRDGLLAVGNIKELTPITLNTTNTNAEYIFLGKNEGEDNFGKNHYLNINNSLFYSMLLQKSNKIYDGGAPSIYCLT